MTREPPAVLVAAEDAGEYLAHLQAPDLPGLLVSCATSTEELRRVWKGQPVLLAQPGLVAPLLADMPGIRWVQSTWAGVTPILEVSRRDFQLTGIREVFGPQMFEYVLAYLLAHELRLFERLGRQAGRHWWPRHSGTLRGKVLGVMGTGSIGAYIARQAQALGMATIGFSRSGKAVDGFGKVYGPDWLEDFLALPDYLVCVLPDTPGTRGLLDTRALAAMKKGVYMVNIGRGSLIDEVALAEAVSAGQIAGAALDVFGEEPLPADSPLWHTPGVIVTAHVAAVSRPAEIADIFLANYRRFVAGRRLKYRVDFDRGY